MRVDQIAPSSILSAVTANAIPVYSQMRLSALTRRKIPFMTVVAISTDSAAADFLTISCFDEEAETLLSGVIIRNMGISSAVGDVESAILYRVAMRTPNPVTKRALLSSALADYPGSAFTEAIQNALQAPPPEAHLPGARGA